MSEDIEAVFNNGCPTLTDNWLEELKRHTTVLLVDLPPVPSAPLFGGSYAASMAHEEYAEQKFRFDWLPGLTYRSPLLVKIPDDNERPRPRMGHRQRRQPNAQDRALWLRRRARHARRVGVRRMEGHRGIRQPEHDPRQPKRQARADLV